MAFDPTIPSLAHGELERVASNASIDAGIYMLNATMGALPKVRFGSYTSNADAVQRAFFALGGGNIFTWTSHMRRLVGTMHAAHEEQYASFIASGAEHCRSQDNGFFSVAAAGVALYKWLAALVDGELPASQAAVDCCA